MEKRLTMYIAFYANLILSMTTEKTYLKIIFLVLSIISIIIYWLDKSKDPDTP